MRIIKCFLVALVVAAFLSGCAAVTGVKSGNADNYRYVRDSVVVGKTTLNEVREKAGEPSGQEQRGDGSVAWTYKSSSTKGFYSMMGNSIIGKELDMGSMQSATILFDPSGVVVGVSGSDVDGGKTSSFSRGAPVNAYGISFPAQPQQQTGTAGGASASSVPPTSLPAEQPHPVTLPAKQKKPAPKPTM